MSMTRFPGISLWIWVCVLLTPVTMPGLAQAQGNIFGAVKNSNLTSPPANDLYWAGFLNHSDQEIRIEINTGAGYDGNDWFDDFQNYTTRAAGLPYDYYFVNAVNGEMFHLVKTIPVNSFQQEDVALAAGSFPARPTGLLAKVASPARVNLTWNSQTGVTLHVYRRATLNNGVYKRLDDPLGRLTSVGVADSFFVDSTADGFSGYTYVIIGQNSAGNFSAHSVTATAVTAVLDAPAVASITPDTGAVAGGYIVTARGTNFDIAGASVTIRGVSATSVSVQSPLTLTCTVPAGTAGYANVVVTNTVSALASAPLVNGFRYGSAAFVRGDVNADGVIDVFDLTYLIDYIFSGGPSPLPVDEAGNADGDPAGTIDVFDLTYLIDFMFSGGPAPPP